MLGLLFDLLMRPVEALFERAVSKSRRDDLVYKKNLQDLIERNRRFEKSE